MLAALEADALGFSNVGDRLRAAAAARADALIVDGEPAAATWTGWAAVLHGWSGPRPRIIPRVAVELPRRGAAPHDWRPVLTLEDSPTIILRVRSTDNFDRAYRDAIAALQPLVSELVRAGVRPILEPAGTLVRSREVWFLREAIEQDAGPGSLAVAWRPLATVAAPETPSVAIMRLARALRLVFLPALPHGAALPQPAEGEGNAWIPWPALGRPASAYFVIEQLKGIAFDGLVGLTPAEDAAAFAPGAAAAAIALLREEWAKPPIPLTAYKGDKHAPRFARPAAAAAALAPPTAEPAR